MQSLRIIEESTGNGNKESNHMFIVLALVLLILHSHLRKKKKTLHNFGCIDHIQTHTHIYKNLSMTGGLKANCEVDRASGSPAAV